MPWTVVDEYCWFPAGYGKTSYLIADIFERGDKQWRLLSDTKKSIVDEILHLEEKRSQVSL